MTPPDESGVYQRITTPPAVMPTDTINTAPTRPMPGPDPVEVYLCKRAELAEAHRRERVAFEALTGPQQVEVSRRLTD